MTNKNAVKQRLAKLRQQAMNRINVSQYTRNQNGKQVQVSDHTRKKSEQQLRQEEAGKKLKESISRAKQNYQQIEDSNNQLRQKIQDEHRNSNIPFRFEEDSVVIEDVERFNEWAANHPWMDDNLPLKQECRNFLERLKKEDPGNWKKHNDRDNRIQAEHQDWLERKNNPEKIEEGYETPDQAKQRIQKEFQDYLNVPLKQVGDDISIEDIDAFDEWATNHPWMQEPDRAKTRIEEDLDYWKKRGDCPEEVIATQLEMSGDDDKREQFWDEYDRVYRSAGLNDEGHKAATEFAKQYAKDNDISLDYEHPWLQESDHKRAAESAMDAFARGEISSDELMKAYDAIESREIDRSHGKVRVVEIDQDVDEFLKEADRIGDRYCKFKSEADRIPKNQNPFQWDS